MNQLRAIYAAIRLELKQNNESSVSRFMNMGITGIAFAAVYAWIVRQSGNPTISTYVLIGAPLMSICNRMIFRVGWSLTSESNSGTLEFSLISQTPMISVFIGKTLAQLISSFANAALSFITILLMLGGSFTVAEIKYLPFSLLLAIVSIIMVSLFFSPFMTLSKGRGGFFNAFMPFVAVLSGFLFPIDRLPLVLQVVARLLPTSWAMDAIWQSVQWTNSWCPVVTAWTMCLLLSALWFAIIYLMFKMVEKRIRVTGTLGTY